MTTPAPLKRRLSAADAIYLYWEHPTQPMHVGECMVYEGHFSADDVIGILEKRMHLIPRYRQKVVFSPFGIAHPTWEDDPDFDLRNHVDELALPAPGDDRVLSEVGGRLFGQLLDRKHPVWKATVLQGHESGGSVLFLKMHHAMVDGVSAVDLVEVLHDLEPDAKPRLPPTVEWEPSPEPDSWSLLRDAIADQVAEAVRLGWDATRFLRPSGAKQRLQQVGVLAKTWIETLPLAFLPPPSTPFNRAISGARQFAWLELPFEEVRSVRAKLGGTVNDLVLAILSGGLGRYMRRHGYETSDVELRGMCPVNMRRPDDRGGMGNLVSLVIVPLYVGIADPRQRLQAERAAMDQLKHDDQAGGLYDMMRLAHRMPPPVQSMIWRFSPRWTWPLNIVSTNVPGPRVPMYLAGHELVHWYPLGVPWTSLGLFLCALSFRDKLVLGLVVDPKIVPNVWDVIEDLRSSYEELRLAAEPAGPTGLVASAKQRGPAEPKAQAS